MEPECLFLDVRGDLDLFSAVNDCHGCLFGKDGIGGGALDFVVYPILYPGQPLGRLMDVFAVDDVAKRLQDLLKTIDHVGERSDRCLRRSPANTVHQLILLHSATANRPGGTRGHAEA